MPRCRAIATVGDVNPVEYGGGFIYQCRERDGGFSYKIEIAEVDDNDELADVELYRVDIPDDVWDYFNFADVRSVASTIGADVRELRAAGKSRDVLERAWAVEAIAANYGWHELDHYRLVMSPKELQARWRAELKRGVIR